MNAPRNIFSAELLAQDRARVEASVEFQPLETSSAQAYLQELQKVNTPEHQIRVAMGHRYDVMCALKDSEGIATIELDNLKGTKIKLPL